MIPLLLLLAVGVGQQPLRVISSCQGFDGVFGSSCVYAPEVAPKQSKPGYKRTVLKDGYVVMEKVKDAQQDAPVGKSAPVALLGPKIQPPDKPCDPKYEYEGMTMPDKPGFAGKVLCAPVMHPLKESEYQEIMERLKKLEKDSVRMTEPVIACDDPQNAKGCKWLPNPNVLHPER